MLNCIVLVRRFARYCAVNAQLRAIFELLATTASALRCAVTQGGYRGEPRNTQLTNRQDHVPPCAVEIDLKIGSAAKVSAQLVREFWRAILCAQFLRGNSACCLTP